MATTHNTTVQNQWWPWQQLAAYFKMANSSVSLQMAVGVLRLHWGIAQLGLSYGGLVYVFVSNPH